MVIYQNVFHQQAIQVEIDGDDHIGMPFVLRSDDKWIKNHGFDFYFELDIRSVESSEVFPCHFS